MWSGYCGIKLHPTILIIYTYVFSSMLWNYFDYFGILHMQYLNGTLNGCAKNNIKNRIRNFYVLFNSAKLP